MFLHRTIPFLAPCQHDPELPTAMWLAASNHGFGCQQPCFGCQQLCGWLPTNHVIGCQQPCGWLPTTMWLAANKPCDWLPTTANHVVGCQQLGGWLPTNHVIGCQQLPKTMWLAANNHVVGCQQLCGGLPTTMWLAANNNDVVKKSGCSGQTVVVLTISTCYHKHFTDHPYTKKTVLKCSRITVILHVSCYFHRFPEIFPCLCKSPALCPYKFIDHT